MFILNFEPKGMDLKKETNDHMELAFVFPDEIITIFLVDGDFQQAGGEDRPPTGSLCSDYLVMYKCKSSV